MLRFFGVELQPVLGWREVVKAGKISVPNSSVTAGSCGFAECDVSVLGVARPHPHSRRFVNLDNGTHLRRSRRTQWWVLDTRRPNGSAG